MNEKKTNEMMASGFDEATTTINDAAVTMTASTSTENDWGFGMAKGIALILLGFFGVFWPVSTFTFLIYALAVFAVIMGIVDMIAGLFSIGRGGWRWLGMMVGGLFLTILGVLVFRYPEMSVAVYGYLLGFAFLIGGIVQFFSDEKTKNDPSLRTMQVVDGTLNVILGILILLAPLMSVGLLYWLLAFYCLIAGVVLVATSGRSYDHPSETVTTTTMSTGSKTGAMPA